MVDKAWLIAQGEVPPPQGQVVSIEESVFIAFALNHELEQARAEGLREEEANLSRQSCFDTAFDPTLLQSRC